MPRTHNADRQFHCAGPAPGCALRCPGLHELGVAGGADSRGVVHQGWFIHVAQGGNLRTAKGLPVPLTRRQAHLYLQAPADFDVLGAFRWAQILDMGGDERLVRSILGTLIGKSFDHDEFWVTVLRWLVDQPMLDPVHHAPIIDYLNNQRFVASVPNPLAGLPGQPALVPPQPNLTMKGRDPESLLHSIDQWHRRLGRVVRGPASYWRPTGIEPFRHEEGEGKSRRIFTITEIVNSYELLAEGQAMAHCVASYAPSCVRGIVSIWSLRADRRDRAGNPAAHARGLEPRVQDRPGPAEVQRPADRARARRSSSGGPPREDRPCHSGWRGDSGILVRAGSMIVVRR